MNTHFECMLCLHAQMIKEAIYKEHKIDTKVSPVDLVTETDKAVEKHIFSRLLSIYPSHATIGEESASENAQVRCELSDTPTWIVDPIDGTTNFVHRYPYTCVSIGLTIKKHVVIGVIYNPLVDEMYTATRGGGAYLNGKRLSVTKSEALRGSLVICELGSDRAEEVLDARLAHIKAVIREAHGVRCCGSAALNLCALAAGRADAYLDFGLHCWDVAAGALILNEAGGVVTNVPPGDSAEALTVQGCLQHYDMMRRHVLAASTPQLAREIASCIKPVYYQPE